LNRKELKNFLDEKAALYNNYTFIDSDPISIPHRFNNKQDIEIAALFAATISWGQRKTIIDNSLRLMKLMDMVPHQFITQHQPQDLKRFNGFVHRTFNETDLLYFIDFLKRHFKKFPSLEDAFIPQNATNEEFTYDALTTFHMRFFDSDYAPARTRKHISTPLRHSACKRLNMFLRWMVRKDKQGVDFGLWKKITPAQLICPLDVHVQRVARNLNLLTRSQNDWRAAIELTQNLRLLDAEDPIRYDFALFGIGVIEKNKIKML
jgi:uncharacterized protein (TIGR02757 family)